MIASFSNRFICIVDTSKLVEVLGENKYVRPNELNKDWVNNFYDLNDDGLVDNSDLEILVSYVIEQSTYGDINQNFKVDIFDVLTIVDFLYFY